MFSSAEDYEQFVREHSHRQVPSQQLETYQGPAYLGIDAGSTTAKVALIGEDNTLLYTFYGANQGDPLTTIRAALLDLYRQLPEGVTIVSALATGYGEQLVNRIEKRAKGIGIKRLFVLTTRTEHWFVERGFRLAHVEDLPKEKRDHYNYQRRSKILIQPLNEEE